LSEIQTPPPEDFFRRLEAQRTQALVAQDMPTLERLHAPGYELITPAGATFTRERYLAAIAAEPFYAFWEPGVISVRMSLAMAVLRYRARLGFPSGRVVECWHLDTYELGQGGWQAVWSQATGIGGNPNPQPALPANRSIPEAVVLPELTYEDVDSAADWLCRAFGFVIRLRIGGHRMQLRVGGGGGLVLKQGEATRDTFAGQSLMVRVADVDAHYAQAVAAGAEVSGPPTTYPYGERQYGARDFAGHAWVFTQTLADVDPADWGGEWLARPGAAQ